MITLRIPFTRDEIVVDVWTSIYATVLYNLLKVVL